MENDKIKNIIIKCEKKCQREFKKIDKICLFNSNKVLSAFQKNKVSSEHFNGTTGYGYDDLGREIIEKVYSTIFKSEDALVRREFISGTHALTVSLFGILRPNDIMLCITGKPYDTLDEVIGIRNNNSSLKSYGINYEQIDLLNNDFDILKIEKRIKTKKYKLIYIQRSRGYSNRESITILKLKEIIDKIRKIDNEVIIMIDNCYCEFVCDKEPIEVGANIAVGSLIKNLGGGIAQVGAYVVGDKKYIKLIAERLTAPGLGKEIGPSLNQNKSFLQGLYMAPLAVSSSLKTAVLTSNTMETLGYETSPKYNEERADIVQSIIFNDREKLINYIDGIQKGSAINSYVKPIPSNMPGYDNEIIMASGSFVDASSIELSADGPLKEPYIAYQQGSLTYEYGKIGLEEALNYLLNR